MWSYYQPSDGSHLVIEQCSVVARAYHIRDSLAHIRDSRLLAKLSLYGRLQSKESRTDDNVSTSNSVLAVPLRMPEPLNQPVE